MGGAKIETETNSDEKTQEFINKFVNKEPLVMAESKVPRTSKPASSRNLTISKSTPNVRISRTEVQKSPNLSIERTTEAKGQPPKISKRKKSYRVSKLDPNLPKGKKPFVLDCNQISAVEQKSKSGLTSAS